MKFGVLLILLLFAFLVSPVLSEIPNEVKTDDRSGVIKIKPIDERGNIKHQPIDAELLSTVNNTVVSIELENTTKVKEEKMIMQIKPGSKTIISSDGKKIKQTKANGKPFMELYYGYQKSQSVPWEKYSRVESCDSISCKVVFANFADRRVWIETRPIAEIVGMANSDTIPDFVGDNT